MNAIVGLYDKIYSHYRLVNFILTLGLDNWWRRKTVDYIKKISHSTICDICCGSGDFTKILITKFKEAEITGVDANSNMLEIAKKRIKNANFINSYISEIPLTNDSFDIVTVSFATRNIFFSDDFLKSITEIKRILKEDGVFISLETTLPDNPISSFLVRIYLNISIGLINLILPESSKSYSFLRSSIKAFKVSDFADKIKPYFKSIEIKVLFPGVVALCIARKN